MTKPLAARMRPRNLDEFVGQSHILGPGSPLRLAIEADKVPSFILYGPPGSGKTSLAAVIATQSHAHFDLVSAVKSGVKELRSSIAAAEELLSSTGGPTILFVDEIHRFNKGQQDALLHAVEDGTISLIGATTENPYHEVNAPLVSRLAIYELKALSVEELKSILTEAISDEERGLGELKLLVDAEALERLAALADGDARKALNLLDTCAAQLRQEGMSELTLETVKQVAGRKALRYDKGGDAHYDTISAFIKSLRGSDPDAAVYWLARMIYGGEDPKFIARRMIVFASEDIGNADPRALQLAMAAAYAVEFVGLPECRINLSQAATYLAVAAKSNSAYLAIDKALADVGKEAFQPVPEHLRSSSYPGAKKLGHGQGYQYPHNFPDHWAPQDYLPPGVQGRRYYEPSENGLEVKIAERLEQLRKRGVRSEK